MAALTFYNREIGMGVHEVAGRLTSPELRALRSDRQARRGAIQSTNCAVGLHHDTDGRQSRAGSFTEALANVVAGYLLALAGQQVVLPLFAIHVGLAAHAGIAAFFTLLSLMRSYGVRRLFEHMAWQRREEERLRRERLERRFARRLR